MISLRQSVTRSFTAVSPTAVDASAVRRSVALCRFVWNATIKSWASGGYSSPRPSRQREWGESPSAVRVAGQKSHDRQPVGEHSGKRTVLRSTRKDEGPSCVPALGKNPASQLDSYR